MNYRIDLYVLHWHDTVHKIDIEMNIFNEESIHHTLLNH